MAENRQAHPAVCSVGIQACAVFVRERGEKGEITITTSLMMDRQLRVVVGSIYARAYFFSVRQTEGYGRSSLLQSTEQHGGCLQRDPWPGRTAKL